MLLGGRLLRGRRVIVAGNVRVRVRRGARTVTVVVRMIDISIVVIVRVGSGGDSTGVVGCRE